MRIRSLALISCMMLSVALAQQAPAPANQPAPPPPVDAAAPPAPAVPAPQKVTISLPKATGNDIAQFYRQLTGERVLVDSTAANIEANIIIFGEGENKEDAVKAFNKALQLNGLAIIPSGPNEVKLINVNAGVQNAKIEGVPVVTSQEDIPEGDNVITYVMPLQYIKPEEAQRTFLSVVGVLHRYGTITAVPNASTLIITENASVVRTLIQLKEKIDVPSQQIATKWADVKYADVEALALTLEKITQPQQNAQAQTARRTVHVVQVAAPAGGAAPQPGGMTQGGTEDIPPQIIPDVRTNRILMMGRPVDMVFLETLIKEFDVPTDTRNFLRQKLRYVSVSSFMPVAQNALERLTPAQPGQPGQNQQQQQQARSNQPQNNQQRNNNSSSVGGSDMLTAPEASGAPESIIVGRTLLVADTITNSIVVQGPPQSIEVISQLLEQIDVRGPQVMISTVFGQFTRSDNKDFGLDWLATVKESGKFTWAGSDLNTGTNWDPTNTGDYPNRLPINADGLSFYGKFAGNLNFLLRAAMHTGKFSVLSRPTVYTVNNQKAVIASGQKVAVPTNTLSDVSGGSLATNTSINYKDIVLKLEVIPLVNSEKEVTLQVGQLNDQITGYQKIGGTNVTEVPTISTQQIITTVTVPNGGTVILGGLITRDTTDSKSGIPVLSDIPLLGWAFSSTTKKIEEKEIVIFIQPTIVMDEKDGYEVQVKERSKYQVTPDIIEFSNPNWDGPANDALLPPPTENYDDSGESGNNAIPTPAPGSNKTTKTKNQRKTSSATKSFGSF